MKPPTRLVEFKCTVYLFLVHIERQLIPFRLGMLTFVKAFPMPKDSFPNLNSRFEYEGLKTYINQESVGHLQQHDNMSFLTCVLEV